MSDSVKKGSDEKKEIAESEATRLLLKSKDTITKYLLAHPGIVYKGIPFLVIVWMAYPLLFAAWSWLPWLWASYEAYKILPNGTLSLVMSLFKDKKWLLEICRNPTIQE